MTPEKTKKAFDDCAEMIQESFRLQGLCTIGKKVRFTEGSKMYVGPTRVLGGWIVGYEVLGDRPHRADLSMFILHVKPEVQHMPQAHALKCKATEVLLEDIEDLRSARFPAEQVPEDSRVMLQHALWMCEEGKALVEQGRTEKAMRWLGFVQGTMWGLLNLAIDDMKRINMPEGEKPA